MAEDMFLDMAGIAKKTGLAYATVRFHHNKADARRREGTPKPGDFPPPDQHFGRSPVWRESTVDTWLANRPGRGAGGGRPRKQAEE